MELLASIPIPKTAEISIGFIPLLIVTPPDLAVYK